MTKEGYNAHKGIFFAIFIIAFGYLVLSYFIIFQFFYTIQTCICSLPAIVSLLGGNEHGECKSDMESILTSDERRCKNSFY